jgi:hypothetical protein
LLEIVEIFKLIDFAQNLEKYLAFTKIKFKFKKKFLSFQEFFKVHNRWRYLFNLTFFLIEAFSKVLYENERLQRLELSNKYSAF